MKAQSLDRDPLRKSSADRLHYSTGELLGADDFVLEQTYHRRQLARALLFLHGRGAVAGLKVITTTTPGRDKPAPATGEYSEIHLLVEPGLAIDGAGRLIEVPRSACLRLRRWFNFVAGRAPASRTPSDPAWDRGDLRAAWFEEATIAAGGAIVVDVFLAFHACDQGYTPAFASGPFDSLDASQPSRVRDGYELSAVLRRSDEPLPKGAFDPWQAIAGTEAERLEKARQASLNAWKDMALPTADEVKDWNEAPAGTEPSAVLLARLKIPAAAPPADPAKVPAVDWTIASWATPEANIDNNVRNFVLPSAAVRRLLAP
jgi:hypothetical protein